MAGYVYILASGKHRTLYIGVTSNLARRVEEHKRKVVKGFTATYGVDRLIWAEATEGIADAVAREKQMKKWKREWKIRLIEESNPEWDDLSHSIF